MFYQSTNDAKAKAKETVNVTRKVRAKVTERKEKDTGRETEKAKEKAMANTMPTSRINLEHRAGVAQMVALTPTRTVNQLMVGPHQANQMLVSADS